MIKNRNITIIGALLGLSLVFGYIEIVIPSFLPNPAFKIGFSQIPILLTFYLLNLRAAATVSFGKVLLMSLLFGYFLTYLFFVNMTGAFFSVIFIWLSKKMLFSLPMTSLMSSLGHNIGQFLVIGYTLGWNVALFFLPLIIVFSIIFGLTIGFITKILLTKIEKRI